LFIEPTLKRIQEIVKKTGGVQYAEVGKTSVAGLNGVESKVTSNTVSAFDETAPLRLSELLKDAADNKTKIDDIIPAETPLAAGNLPTTSVLSLIAALDKNRTEWRELASGIELTITPSVLRSSTSAELSVAFKAGVEPPTTGQTSQGNLRPLSRIKNSSVTTKVYVNTLDFFALSTFNNQTTVDGGRTFIPIVGTIWKGIFGSIPILGDLFSWKNAPKNVHHQSLILTNTFIVPTAMGLAPLYRHDRRNDNILGVGLVSSDFATRRQAVDGYLCNNFPQLCRNKSLSE
jgi:hypothetical protein